MQNRHAAISLLLALVFCSYSIVSATPTEHPTESLYESLGGKEGITSLVNKLFIRVASDDRINNYFSEFALDREAFINYKANLANEICDVSDGPCNYEGKRIKDDLKNRGLSKEAYNALGEDIKATLDELNINSAKGKQLVSALGLCPLYPFC